MNFFSRRGRIVFGGLMVLWGTTCPLAAQIVYHVQTNGNDAADGLSWATAKSNLAATVAIATNGDTVRVGTGTHVVATWIQVTNAIRLEGIAGPTGTVLDAQAVNGRRLMLVSNAQALVAGFTLRRGEISSWTGPGALRLYSGTVSNCAIQESRAYLYAGGVWMSGGLLTHCSILGNTGHSSGSNGGGLYLDGGTVTDCLFSNNQAYVSGSGIYMTGGSVRNSLITHNVHNTSYASTGCGVAMTGGTLEQCVIRNNQGATLSGGGVHCSGGRILNCLIYNNRVTAQGGGVYLAAGSGQIQFSTVVGNQAVLSGSGVHQVGGAISNCIVVENGASPFQTRGDNIVAAGGVIAYTVSDPLPAGTGNSRLDPLFRDSAALDFRLFPGSPAIDSAADIPGVATDLEQQTRPLDGDLYTTSQLIAHVKKPNKA